MFSRYFSDGLVQPPTTCGLFWYSMVSSCIFYCASTSFVGCRLETVVGGDACVCWFTHTGMKRKHCSLTGNKQGQDNLKGIQK